MVFLKFFKDVKYNKKKFSKMTPDFGVIKCFMFVKIQNSELILIKEP